MTDERLYRDDHIVSEAVIAQAQGHDPINGSDSIGARYFVQQPVLAQFEAQKTAAMGRALHSAAAVVMNTPEAAHTRRFLIRNSDMDRR